MLITIIIVVVVLVVIIGAVLVVVAGIRKSKNLTEDPLAERLAEYSQRGETVSLEQIELAQPFSERVVMPFMRRLGEISTRFTPQNVLENTRKKLELAGNPGRMDASTFMILHFVAAVFLGGLIFVISLFSTTYTLPIKILIITVFTVLGYFLPDLLLKSKIDRR